MSEKIFEHSNLDVDPAQTANNIETTQVGGKVYEIEKLRQFAETIPLQEIPLDDVKDAVGEGHIYWIDGNGQQLAPFQILEDWDAAQKNEAWADHVETIKRANLENPIWISKDGHVFDGVHRLTRAVLEKKLTVKAKFFDELPD